MSEQSYAIGVDFGTESGRVLLLDLQNGEELAVHVVSYPSGVIDEALPGSGEQLPGDWALQDPEDWVKVLDEGVPAVMSEAGVPAETVVGIGIDFTSCTALPVTAEGVAMCTLDEWREHPQAWAKLWKHHAAQGVADRLTEVAIERGESFIERYGGKISSEWYFPKLIELWLEDRELYDAASRYIEAADWIVWHMTGSERRQTCTAGYKALWSPEDGLPSTEYFEAAYPGFDRPGEKLGDSFLPLGTRAGTLRREAAERLGLSQETAVAVGNVDSFVSVPGAGVQQPGTYVSVVGTSICDMVVDPQEVRLPGITGVVKDGILPGLYGYEAGQSASGDMLAWFMRTVARSDATFESLEKEAAKLRPGESGLVALDWWNGNRSVLADLDLTGAIFGLTLRSTPDYIYRSLLESIAFGNRRILENFVENGLEMSEIVACGGIATASPLLMQLYADVSGLDVHVPASGEVPARGAALWGAVAAGAFEDIGTAVEALRPGAGETYKPEPEAKRTYDEVYAVYRGLYELLGKTEAELLHKLKRIRGEVTG